MVVRAFPVRRYLSVLTVVSVLPYSVFAAEDPARKNEAGSKVRTTVTHRHAPAGQKPVRNAAPRTGRAGRISALR